LLTEVQTKNLIEAFEIDNYPGHKKKAELAKLAGLNEEKINSWYKQRRFKINMINKNI